VSFLVVGLLSPSASLSPTAVGKTKRNYCVNLLASTSGFQKDHLFLFPSNLSVAVASGY
jgi:hypothetical protein